MKYRPKSCALTFSSNYSASQAAILEFRMYLDRQWYLFGAQFCTPVYEIWLLTEVLKGNIRANGLLDAWRSGVSGSTLMKAWFNAVWYGKIKPSVDPLKMAKASRELIDLGLTTRARESRILTGTKFDHNVRRQKRENELLVESKRPLLELQQEQTQEDPAVTQEEQAIEAFLNG